MKITLLLTGKTKEKYLQTGVEEYVKRINRYTALSVNVIPDLKVTKKTPVDLVKVQEGQEIMQRIRQNDFVVLLDEKGKKFSSEDFASFISGLEGRSGQAVFVVGGAYGFSSEVYKRADAKLSLSDMTFSHQMVRLIFTEQLYRAFTIIKGEPYHHK